ncbi:tetratricopeptide repeat protein, partial [Rhodocyclaceae bacterium SMB388]
LLITEATVLAAHDRRLNLQPTRGFRVWRGVLLGLPSLAILLYLAAISLPSLLTGSAGLRDFTPGERLLTQGRVMWDYIWRLVLPMPHSGGLFNDHITVSTGFFSPLTTAIAWTGWVIVVVLAWRNRQRYPAAALAVLFFLVGHAVESGFLQLELYFEHRNYLPAALLALPVALWWADEQRLTLVTRAGLATALVFALAAMTAMGASLWGKPFQQALKWSQINPSSPRTHHHLAALWLETGNIGAAASHNQRAIALDPANIAARIQALSIACINGEDVDQKFEEVETVLQGKVLNGAVAQYQLGRLLDYVVAGGCPFIELPDALALLERLERQHESGPQVLSALLNQRAAEALLRMERPAEAYERFHRASEKTQPRGVILRNVALLATHGEYEAALSLLDTAWPDHVAPPPGFTIQRLRHVYAEGSGYYERERQALRIQIIADLDNPGR